MLSISVLIVTMFFSKMFKFKIQLGISDVNGIPFQSVHRLGTRPDGKERSIIARFNWHNDHERVRKAASEKLKNKPAFSVYQQYPREIYNRRNYSYQNLTYIIV
jgi:MoaA/NifB/PqqE/SkfB family radical SAM enzyme